ncbi:hypothetical protein N0V88_004388 [Collariella sp. IMI 366227]|nr:hypothetical protein N0V88_004388 [Collariella sp. IMI 366227]
MSSSQTGGLNVIALVSGGKDSFFSLLHCRANGHRVVALANLHPPLPQKHHQNPNLKPQQPGTTSHHHPRQPPSPPPQRLYPATIPHPSHASGPSGNEPSSTADEDERQHQHHDEEEEEEDLNSFMYQTVGHQLIPLYAEATGIPLYRRAITGDTGRHGKGIRIPALAPGRGWW